MNDVQSFLLKLIKEIDEICNKNNIDYYIFAGSILGAERNEGFLPWDDDMDIVMTRENYEKWKKVAKTELPKNRVFECRERNKKYPLTFGKYTSLDSSNMIRSLSYGNCAAGIWIDVMHLSPMPLNERKRNLVTKWFPVYCELDNEFYTEYPYRYKGFYFRYKLLMFLSKLLGKKRILKFIENKLKRIPEDECKDYFLYHALDADFRVFSKDCFIKPKRIMFENIEVNISSNNRKLCREAYGDSWMMIPEVNTQETHSTITDPFVPYTVYKKDFTQLLDLSEVDKDFNQIKQIHIERLHKNKIMADSFLQAEAKAVGIATDNKIKNHIIPMKQLISMKRYSEIGELFSDYIGFQWRPAVKGHGVYAEIKDENLYGLLLYLICEKQEYYYARRLLNLRKQCEKSLPNELIEIESLISILKELSIELWDNKNYKRVLEICIANKEICERLEVKDITQAYGIAVMNEKKQSLEEVENICLKCIENGDTSGVMHKILGDIYYKKNQLEKAKSYYQYSEKTLKNGLLLLDVTKKKKEFINE